MFYKSFLVSLLSNLLKSHSQLVGVSGAQLAIVLGPGGVMTQSRNAGYCEAVTVLPEELGHCCQVTEVGKGLELPSLSDVYTQMAHVPESQQLLPWKGSFSFCSLHLVSP